MRILVTGGTGFIGLALVERLQTDDHEVTVWTRSAPRARKILSQSVRIASANEDELSALVSASDAVVHLAGASIAGGRWTHKRKAELVSSRVVLAERIVEAMSAEPRPGVFVSASAVGYYGDRGDALVTEADPAGDDFLARLCVQWERPGATAAGLGIRVVHPRCGVVLGLGGDFLNRLLPVFKAGLGGRLGDGTQYVSWIHVSDLIELLVRCLTDDRYVGPVNACAPEPVTNRELTRLLGKKLHRPTVLTVPSLALRIAFGDLAEVLLTGQRVLPEKAIEAGFDFSHPTLDAALEDLLGHPA